MAGEAEGGDAVPPAMRFWLMQPCNPEPGLAPCYPPVFSETKAKSPVKMRVRRAGRKFSLYFSLLIHFYRPSSRKNMPLPTLLPPGGTGYPRAGR